MECYVFLELIPYLSSVLSVIASVGIWSHKVGKLNGESSQKWSYKNVRCWSGTMADGEFTMISSDHNLEIITGGQVLQMYAARSWAVIYVRWGD